MHSTLIDHQIKYLLRQVYIKPMATQSNFARTEAMLVAAAASLGLITTQINPMQFGREWRITNKGLLLINEEDLHGRVYHSVEG